MEERGPPATGAADDINDDPVPSSETQLVPYGPIDRPNETYVIHFPKDQIYRVPPPENAIIVEKHRPVTKKKSSVRRHWCLALLVMLLILFFIAGITVLIWYLVVSPKDPTFSITHVSLKKPASNHSDVGYEISLKAVNPNDKMSMSFKDGGGTSLLHDQKGIAKGKFPSDELDDDESDVVKLVLNGTIAALPSDVRESIEETSDDDEKKKTTSPLSLNLKMSDIPLHIKYGFFKSWDKKAEVECKFKVDTFGSSTKVLEQDCDTTLK